MVVETIFHLLLQLLRARANKLGCGSCIISRDMLSQPNLCIISDKGTDLLVALQSGRVGWTRPDISYVYCIHHITSNFNKQFKNVDLKKQVINMGKLLTISCIKFLIYYVFTIFITHSFVFCHRIWDKETVIWDKGTRNASSVSMSNGLVGPNSQE